MLYTLIYAPDGVSTALLLSELTDGLRGLGHEITVLTTTPHYNVDSEARERQPLRRRYGGLLYESTYRGIRVYHIPIANKGSRILIRLFDYILFHVLSLVFGLLKTGPCDIILAPSPPMTNGLVAWLLGKIKHAPFIYNVQEIYPDVAVKLGVIRNSVIIRVLEAMEHFIYARAEQITVISDKFRDMLLARGVPAAALRVIPNFVDVEEISPGQKPNPFSTTHGLDGKFVVLYAGNIGMTQDLESILAAARTLSATPDILFLIVGNGSRRAWLAQAIARQNVANVRLLPYQARSAVRDMYASCDLGLVPLKKDMAIDTFPSKVYTIMAAGRSVVACSDQGSELSNVLLNAECGWLVPPSDPDKLAEVVLAAYSDRAEVVRRGENGRRFVVENNSRGTIASLYDKLIRDVVGASHQNG